MGSSKSFAMADVARIEFQGSAGTAAAVVARRSAEPGHFLGKWSLGTGNGDDFYVTLEATGDATKEYWIGPSGTWTVVNGEAHINLG